MNKKAIEVKVLISMIILILSFALILFLWYQFSWQGTINQETCHTSVILKKSTPEKPLIGEKLVEVPLRCQTEKICLTSGFLDQGCDEFEGIKGVAKKRVSSEEDVLEVLSDSAADCWSMMGEAKGPMVFSRELSRIDQKFYGVICSRIAFSDKVQEEYPVIEHASLVEYLKTRRVSLESSDTYWDFLTQGTQANEGVNFEGANIDTSLSYANVYLEADWGAFNKLLAAASGGLLFSAIGTSFAGPAGAVIGFVVGVVVGEDVGEAGEEIARDSQYSASLQFIKYDVDSLRDLGTHEFEGLV